MKAKRFLTMMVSLSMIMSCMTGATANTTAGLSESYDVTDPESSVQVIADDALTFTNNESLNSGITETGMIKSKVFDTEKGKDVMKLAFNEKVAWNSANNDSTRLYDVMSSLNGLADLLVDDCANTISFDYKVTGSSTGNVGMFFVGKDATELSDYQTRYPLIGLRNGGGITAVARPAAVRGPWNNYVAAEGWASHDSDNTQWNRLTIAIDSNGTGITDVYLNGQKVKFVTNSDGYIGNATNKDKGEIDKILFNTAGEVSQTKDLAILLDNIKVYEGEPKLADTTALTSEFNLINDTSNTGFANMTDGYVLDPVKGAVRKLTFNAKSAEANVRAGLSGFAKYMTNDTVNTICFDYKLSGSSKNHVGLFLNDTAGASYWSNTCTAMILGNSESIQLRNRPNYNASDWYSYAGNTNFYQSAPNNREWNRAILEVNNVTGEVKGYINGEYYGSISGATTSSANLDTIFFNTEPLVGAGGTSLNGLSILLDNIEVYEGAAKLDTTEITFDLTLLNDTSNPGFANMTDGYVFEPGKGTVRNLTFDAKAADANVRAGLSGFSKYMTDETVNTICFDYKLSGNSTNHVGLFLNDTVGASYWSATYASVILGNSEAIQLRTRPNYNASDWYDYAGNSNRYQAVTNNREWNRVMLEINNVTGEVKGYINREYFGSVSDPTTSAANLDTIFFNTKPLVGADSSLSILLDNVEVYPGSVSVEKADYIEVVDVQGKEISEFNAGDTVYVKAGLKNETETATDYIVLLAAYDESGACEDVKIHELKDVKVGEYAYIEGTVLGLTLPDDATNVKAFLWDSWDSITPVCQFDTAVLKTAE